MNRRILAGIAMLVAVSLFVAPLVSPIPNPETDVVVSIGPPEPDPVPAEYGSVAKTTYRYQNLPAAAQEFFDDQVSTDSRELIVPTEVPAPWAPPSKATAASIANNSGQVLKKGQYYPMYIGTYTPQPPLLAAIPRFGALVGAIGSGTISGYFILTAED
ncbi:hypothetical protein [Halocatena salina]|uniref:Uncharacterized protein n=1 Tax=Halocatena salina TaxID=2934340 RepID=A0A8U0A6L4_9EURY|nr:hypothetical protein [Halocatena salina]UPM44821.1 hypothetical protein MW046_15640 [Halocatena salina]